MAIESVLSIMRRSHAYDVLPDSALKQLLSRLNLRWRERLLTPVVALRLFLLQILNANTSITHLRQLSRIAHEKALHEAVGGFRFAVNLGKLKGPRPFNHRWLPQAMDRQSIRLFRSTGQKVAVDARGNERTQDVFAPTSTVAATSRLRMPRRSMPAGLERTYSIARRSGETLNRRWPEFGRKWPSR